MRAQTSIVSTLEVCAYTSVKPHFVCYIMRKEIEIDLATLMNIK